MKTDVDTEYLIKESEKWCRDRAVYNAIMESIQIIDGNEKEKLTQPLPNRIFINGKWYEEVSDD